MNYSKRFKCNAVFDWIEFEIQLRERITYRQIRNSFKRIGYVHTTTKADDSGTSFRFRLQDPNSWDEMQAKLDDIAAVFPFAAKPKISAIEIALDFYARRGVSTNELANLTYRLFHFARAALNKPARFCGSDGKSFERRLINGPSKNSRGIYEINAEEALSQFAELKTCYVGTQPKIGRGTHETPSPVSFRWYVKTIDRDEPLSKSCWRARMEAILCEGALPFTTLEEARLFNIAELAYLFTFRQWNIDAIIKHVTKFKPGTLLHALTMQRLKILTSRPQVGRDSHRARHKAGGGIVKRAEFTKADSPLNELARNAVRRLNKSLRAPLQPTPAAQIRVFSYVEPPHAAAVIYVTATSSDEGGEQPANPTNTRPPTTQHTTSNAGTNTLQDVLCHNGKRTTPNNLCSPICPNSRSPPEQS